MAYIGTALDFVVGSGSCLAIDMKSAHLYYCDQRHGPMLAVAYEQRFSVNTYPACSCKVSNSKSAVIDIVARNRVDGP